MLIIPKRENRLNLKLNTKFCKSLMKARLLKKPNNSTLFHHKSNLFNTIKYQKYKSLSFLILFVKRQFNKLLISTGNKLSNLTFSFSTGIYYKHLKKHTHGIHFSQN